MLASSTLALHVLTADMCGINFVEYSLKGSDDIKTVFCRSVQGSFDQLLKKAVLENATKGMPDVWDQCLQLLPFDTYLDPPNQQ